MIGEFPVWALVPIIVGIIGLRYVFRSKEKPLHPPLGMEEVDLAKFQATVSENARLQTRSFGLDRNVNMEHGIVQTQRIAAAHNSEKPHKITDAKTSAQRLVKGIAFHNNVCLFMAGPTGQASENEQILLDIFAVLNIQPKLVDVSSDNDMHLGLPQSEGLANLPYLYIGGIAFGNFGAILESVQDGSLFTAFSDAGIVIDANAAQSLQKT